MQTGYTAYIEDGRITSGKEFLMLCSRACNLATDIRDEPLSVTTPIHFEPDSYYKEQYDRAIEELERVKKFTEKEALSHMRQDYHNNVAYARDRIAKLNTVNKRYEKIRKQVEAWVPPTEQHKGIKEFALNQIDMCVESNNGDIEIYNADINKPFDDSKESIHRYIDGLVAIYEDHAMIAKSSYEREVQLAKDKTEFMKEFVNSLNVMEG